MTSVIKVDNIQNSSGTAALSIDSTGRVTTPARPAFRVYGPTSAWVSFGTAKVTGLTTVDYNIGSHYSTANSEFTAPIDGLYHFYGHFYVNDSASLSTFYITIDDIAYSHTYFASQEDASGDNTVTFSETFQLTANQTVAIKGNSGEFFSLYSSFGGYLVG
jgi:hypothetical protein